MDANEGITYWAKLRPHAIEGREDRPGILKGGGEVETNTEWVDRGRIWL